MKELKFSEDGKKVIINTGIKIFDKQTSIIGNGCVCSVTQYSNIIRAYNRTTHLDEDYENGELQGNDIKLFHDLPDWIKPVIKVDFKEEDGILYEFRYWKSHSKKVVLGYILTKTGVQNYKFINCFVTDTNKYNIKLNALETIRNYISN